MMVDKRVSVRIAAEGGKQVKAELVEIGREGSRAFQQLDRTAGTSRAGIQNLGFQVQDFAVQVAGGTDATRAMAQQLPQLLSGFGMFGVLLGTASAVLIPFGSYLLGASEKALSLEESVKKLDAAIGDLEGASKAAAAPIDQLLAKYGEYADQAQRIADVNRQLAYLDAASALTATAGALTGMFGQLERVNVEGAKTPEWLSEVEARFGTLNPDSVAAVADALSITTDQAILLTEQMVSLSEARGPEAQVVALQNVIEQLELATGGAFEMDEGTRAVYKSLLDALAAAQQLAAIDMASGVAIAADEAGRLARNLAAAAYGKIQNTGEGGADQAAREAIAKRPDVFGSLDRAGFSGAGGPRRAARAGGGGGGGGATKERLDAEREAARVYESTRTAAEKYAAELARLNELQSAGLISSDTYTRALDDLKKKTGDVSNAMGDLKSSFGEAFTSFVTGAKSAQEAVADLLSSLAETLANSAFQSILSGLFGGGGGGFLSGLFGGGRAGGGPVRAGVSYMVGESGPERLTMPGDGYITPNNALRAGGQGGGVSITINAQGAVEGVAEQVAARIQELLPAITRASVAANRAAAARGY